MLRFIQNLFGHEPKPAQRQNSRETRRSKHNQRRVLGMEGLETRNLMAGVMTSIDPASVPTAEAVQDFAPKTVTVQVKNGDLWIDGTNGANNLAVSFANGKYVVKDTHDVNGKSVTSLTQVSGSLVTGGDIIFRGFKGDDRFSVADTIKLRVTANGGDGNDILTGGGGIDKLVGGDGNDKLYGNFGDDTLSGGDGNDYLDGSLGADKLNGDKGDDIIWGGPGNDTIDGGENADHLYGTDGNDSINVGLDFAPNFVDGGPGNDTIIGGYGIDELHGSYGNDYIDGNLGQDSVYGDDGADTLLAGNDWGYNYVEGGSGDDHLVGSNGGDTLSGGPGNDLLEGGEGNDKLYGGVGKHDDEDFLYGGNGDDELHGDESDNLFGEGGHDTFFRDYFDHYPFRYYPQGLTDREPDEIQFEGTV